MTIKFGLCRDCKHWEISNSSKSKLVNHSRDLCVDDGFIEGRCMRILRSLNVTISCDLWSSSSVDSIETDANFGCVLFEENNKV